jgi:hypothetical protein
LARARLQTLSQSTPYVLAPALPITDRSRIRLNTFSTWTVKKKVMLSIFQQKDEQEILDAQNLLNQQIMDLGSALFFSEGKSELQLPVHIINNVVVDDQQQIWFLIHRPTQTLSEFDAVMPAKLDFFKKGMSYQVKVTGTAYIVDDAAKVAELAGEGVNTQSLVAIKVAISKADYLPTIQQKPAQSNWLKQTKMLSSFFFA